MQILISQSMQLIVCINNHIFGRIFYKIFGYFTTCLETLHFNLNVFMKYEILFYSYTIFFPGAFEF
jgi:hypothetical protein